MAPTNILIVGHSIIRRMRDNDTLDVNFWLDGTQTRYLCWGGAKAHQFVVHDELYERLCDTHIAYFQLGENDISLDRDVWPIVGDIIDICHNARRVNPNITIIWGQLLGRPKPDRDSLRSLDEERLFKNKVAVRRSLRQQQGTHYWRHVGATQNIAQWLLSDGVHLNNLGEYKLWRSIRGALIPHLGKFTQYMGC